ncbi:MAG: hypothetical protein PVI86_18205 [Phycisphaerae bacterium]|jgi:hypothetical protein
MRHDPQIPGPRRINALTPTLIFAAVFSFGALCAAQEPKTPTQKEVTKELSTGKRPAAVTIEAIMEQAVRNIAARYNLNTKQTDITRKMMKEGVYRFLEEHEADVWPVIRDLLASGLQTPEDVADMRRIGKAARPLLEAAQKSIYEYNDQWRTILSEEQKRVHDFDLAEMKETFAEVDHRFHEWETGKASEESLLPDVDQGKDIERPSKPSEDSRTSIIEVFDPASGFELFVEQFIKDYKLDEGQVTAAKSILEEFKIKANDYRTAKKKEFTEIAARQQHALDNKDLAEVKRAHAAHKKLLAPVYQLHAQMEDRLMGLLTTAQIQQHAEKTEARRSSEKNTRTASAVKVKTVSPKKAGSAKNKDTGPKSKTAAKTPEDTDKPESRSDR